MKILIRIAYDGTNFAGYQFQPGLRTVQRSLNEAARALFGFDCDITGCSRTDSGVHAGAFYATVSEAGKEELHTQVPLRSIPPALCTLLPLDVAVTGAWEVPDDFHARYDVVKKEYCYRIWNGPLRSPFEEHRACHFKPVLTEEDAARMNLAASYFVGTHDFSSFMAQGSKVSTTVRTVYAASVAFAPGENDGRGRLLIYRVSADGFLYNMVRIMAGTVLNVGLGRTAPEEIPRILAAHDREAAGPTAPGCGLYLSEVFYPAPYDSLRWDFRKNGGDE